MKDRIYMDHAATSAVCPEAKEAMLPYFDEKFGNPSSSYGFAAESKEAVEQARSLLAASIGAKPEEIYFTSGGTEADNWAIKGTAEALASKGNHIITTKIEHHAVLHTCQWLEKHGFRITYLGVDETGKVRLDDLKRAICPETILISVMAANNEIGTLEPVREIGAIAKEHGIYFHTDAVQSYPSQKIRVNDSNIDLLSVSSHKLNGPKGIGFLYIRSGVSIAPFLHGGAQEKSQRAGTENVPAIVGFAKAAEISMKTMSERTKKEKHLRDLMIDLVMKQIPYTRLNGSKTDRLPGNVNFSFQFVEGESLLILLDTKNICVSTGSACNASSSAPSHVLKAIGLPDELAFSSLRMTLGEENTEEEVRYVAANLKEIVEELRNQSGWYQSIKKH
jgi:cysteine desulfurase